MVDNTKRFARRVLLVHLLLLIGVLALLGFVAHEIYSSTRAQIIEQAKSRQTLLASQTARGIESYYQSILSNLDLLRRAENEETPSRTPLPGPSLEERTLVGTARGAIIGPILWKQLQGRVSLLFGVDQNTVTSATPSTRVIGTDDPSVQPGQIVAQAQDWLKGLDKPAVSQFHVLNGQGYNLVCVPFPRPPAATQPEGGPQRPDRSDRREPPPRDFRGDRPGDRPGRFQARFLQAHDNIRMLVAVVPIAPIENKFLKSVNDDPATGAWLVDEQLTTMSASRKQMVGANMGQITDAGLRDLVTGEVKNGTAGTEQLDRPFRIGSHKFMPSLVSGQPLQVGGNNWELFITTAMPQVDGALFRLLHRALLWGIILVVSIVAILVSTAVQMIRSRIRVERMRHEILTKELNQAREIQLAWLPVQQPSPGAIDIAAVNHPANHISGDFYNWFELPDGRQVVTIGDVTGHGMSAAFLMATTQLLVRNTMERVGDPGKCLEEVNRQLCVQVFNGQFVTMLVMVMDLKENVLELATAGHPAPLLTDNGTLKALPMEPQLVLGVDRHSTYNTERFALTAPMGVLLYTDGVVDCINGSGARFSTAALQKTLQGSFGTAQAMLDRVSSAISAHRGDQDLDDDLTLVSVRLKEVPTPIHSLAEVA